MTIEQEVETKIATEAPIAHRLPTSYGLATWRSTTPVDDKANQIGITLVNDQGEVVRYRLPLVDALHLTESITEYYTAYLARTQSPRSSGIPSIAVSTPLE